MVNKHYSEEFKRQAVDLYESTEGATLRTIAADLGIGRSTLAGWVKRYGNNSITVASPNSSGSGEDPAMKELKAENAKLRAERDILRQAAKYFAGETIW